MKRIFILATALFIATSSFTASAALPFLKFGIKAGLSTENQRFKADIGALQDIVKDSGTGFHVGAVARVDIPLIPIHVQPEFVYNWNKVKVGDEDISATYKINNFSIPVMLGFGVGLGDVARLRLNLGPVFNLNTKVNVNSSDSEIVNFSGTFERETVSWAAGVGADLLGLMVDLRYNGQFKKKSIESPIGSVNLSPTSWSLSVGFLF